MKSFLSSLFAAIFLIGIGQTQKEISLEELKTLYTNYYLTSDLTEVGWKNKGKCDPGTIPNEVYAKAEKRINFYRLVNRLPEIKVVNDKRDEAQAAAFMCAMNGQLSHDPPTTWKCYSKKGAEGASRSCLGYNSFYRHKMFSFIDGWIADIGKSNQSVGHRRWVLSSTASGFSYGAAEDIEALYCEIGTRTDTVKNDFIAYPWSGYVPVDFIFCKWSFSIPRINEVDFTKAKVSVKDKKGKIYPVTLLTSQDGYADKTIVWTIESLIPFSKETDSEYYEKIKSLVGEELSVKVENVKVNKKIKTYEYKVKITSL